MNMNHKLHENMRNIFKNTAFSATYDHDLSENNLYVNVPDSDRQEAVLLLSRTEFYCVQKFCHFSFCVVDG